MLCRSSILFYLIACTVFICAFSSSVEIPELTREEYLQAKRVSAPSIESFTAEGSWCGTDAISDSSSHFSSQGYTIPSCGVTPCDDPNLVRGYSGSLYLNLMPKVTIPYNVYYYAYDNGSNPLVSMDRNAYQQYLLNSVYGTMNVTWQGKAVVLKNSWWRNSWVVKCSLSSMTDSTCTSSCSKFINGFDGGACNTDYTNFINACGPASTMSACRTQYSWYTKYYNTLMPACSNSLVGNGVCDRQCNFKTWNWDGGDCCLQNYTSDPFLACKNPSSSNRAWRSESEFRQQIGASATNNLNVYIVQMSPDDLLLGFATLPWSSNVFQWSAGAMFNVPAWGNWTNLGLYGVTAVHEFGHVLGLYHPFHSEELTNPAGCTNACWESPGDSTMLNGDLCDDTGATPVNYNCYDPTGTDSCNGKPYTNSPYKNFMNYGDDNCLDEFTQTQMARMRCYVDYSYQNWINQTLPGTIVQQPSVTVSGNSTTVTWNAPINPGGATSASLKYFVRRQDSVTGKVVVFPPTTLLTFNDNTCTNATRCSYRVMAQNRYGNATFYSPPSNFAGYVATPTPTPKVLLSGATTVAPSTIRTVQNVLLLIVLAIISIYIF